MNNILVKVVIRELEVPCTALVSFCCAQMPNPLGRVFFTPGIKGALSEEKYIA